jgi:hypothetical protein
MEMETTQKDYLGHFWWEPKGPVSPNSDIVFNIMFHDPKTQLLLKDITFDMDVYQKGVLLESRTNIDSPKGYTKENFMFSDVGSTLVVIKNINDKKTEAEFQFEVSKMAGMGMQPRYPLELVPVFTGLLIAFPVIWYTIKNRKAEVSA